MGELFMKRILLSFFGLILICTPALAENTNDQQSGTREIQLPSPPPPVKEAPSLISPAGVRVNDNVTLTGGPPKTIGGGITIKHDVLGK